MNSGVAYNVDVERYAACYKAGYWLRLHSNRQPGRSVTAGAVDE